jgi:hypothetical protein
LTSEGLVAPNVSNAAPNGPLADRLDSDGSVGVRDDAIEIRACDGACLNVESTSQVRMFQWVPTMRSPIFPKFAKLIPLGPKVMIFFFAIQRSTVQVLVQVRIRAYVK